MFTIHFTKNTSVTFYDKKGRAEWYGSDYGHREKMVVRDIVSANKEMVFCVGYDYETVGIPLDAISIS